MLAVSVDPPERSAEIVDAYGLEFPVLSDPDATTVREYGLLHEGGGMEGDIARPATFLIDRQGRIVWRHLPDNWRVRVRPQRLIERLKALP